MPPKNAEHAPHPLLVEIANACRGGTVTTHGENGFIVTTPTPPHEPLQQQYVWLVEVGRVGRNRLNYIVQATDEAEAHRKITADITYKALLRLPGKIEIKNTLIGIPNPGTEWGDRYILL